MGLLHPSPPSFSLLPPGTVVKLSGVRLLTLVEQFTEAGFLKNGL